MDSTVPNDNPKVKPIPAILDAGAESFQTALDHLSSAHSLEVGALQRENSWLKVQVGQLQSSLKKLHIIGSNQKPGIAFVASEAYKPDSAEGNQKPGLAAVASEACEPIAAWPVHGPLGDDDDWAALGSVAEDPEPDIPRHLPQVQQSKFQDLPLESILPLSGRISENLDLEEPALSQQVVSQALPEEETTRSSKRVSAARISTASSKEVMAIVKGIQDATNRVTPPSAKRSVIQRHASARHKHRATSGGEEEIGPIQLGVARIVENNYFDFLCGAMIILNSVLIGWNVQYKTIHYGQDLPAIEISGHICSLFFLLELIMRMISQGRYYFHSENRPWNYFDIILVVYSIVDFLLMLSLDQKNSSGFHSNMKTIKMFRILRVFRVFRFFRELSLLALMIVDSIRSLIWALIMLTVIIYVFAICFTQSASEYIQMHGDAGDPGVERWFGGLFRTVYSLVLAMLGGVSWHEVSDPLLLVHWSQAALFFFYITFTILAVLNIITGVFVDNAVETAGTQREFLVQKEMEIKEKYVKEMRDFFMDMDQDGSGTVTLEEVKEYFDDLRVQSYFQALGIDPADTERLFHLIDDDGSGEISVDEFLDGCLRLKGSARSIDVHALMYECKRLGNRQDEMFRLIVGELPVTTAKAKAVKKKTKDELGTMDLEDEEEKPARPSILHGSQGSAAVRASQSSGAAPVVPAVPGKGGWNRSGSYNGFYTDSENSLKVEAARYAVVSMDRQQDCSSMAISPTEIGVALDMDHDRKAVNASSTSTAAVQSTSQTNSPPDSSGARSSPGHFTESLEISYEEDLLQEEEDVMSW